MTIIYAATEDQHLIATILPKLAQNNVNTVRLHVEFDSTWSSYPVKSAIFTTSNSVRPYTVTISSGDCLLPPEVLAEECKLFITVEGKNTTTGETKASTKLTVKVLGGHPSVIISDPTPSVYSVLNSRMSALETAGTVDGSEVIGIRTGADGTMYATAGDAVRGQFEKTEKANDSTNRIMYDIYGSVKRLNLIFNKGYGYNVSQDKFIDSANLYTTDLVPIRGFDKLTYQVSLNETYYEVCFFDSYKKIIKEISIAGQNTGYSTREIDLTEISANYVCVTAYYAANGGYGYSAELSKEGNLTETVESLKENKLNNRDVEYTINYDANHFDASSVFLNTEVHAIRGIVACDRCITSNLIKVKPGTVVYINNLPTYPLPSHNISRYIGCFDKDLKILAYMNFQTTLTQVSYTVPDIAGIEYLAFSLCHQLETDEAYESIDYSTVMVTFDGYHNYEAFSPWLYSVNGYKVGGNSPVTAGKQMLIFGDSITETATMNDNGQNYVEGVRTNWMTFAKDILRIENYKNYAKSGAGIHTREGLEYRQQLENQITLAISDSGNDTADIVVISLGTNDGTPNDSYESAMSVSKRENLDKTKFCEALRWAMWTLRLKYSKAKFFIATPIQRASHEQPTALREAIVNLAHRYNFIVIDAEYESGIIRENEVKDGKGRYLTDGLHPNAEGAKLMAKLYANTIIRSYIPQV